MIRFQACLNIITALILIVYNSKLISGDNDETSFWDDLENSGSDDEGEGKHEIRKNIHFQTEIHDFIAFGRIRGGRVNAAERSRHEFCRLREAVSQIFEDEVLSVRSAQRSIERKKRKFSGMLKDKQNSPGGLVSVYCLTDLGTERRRSSEQRQRSN